MTGQLQLSVGIKCRMVNDVWTHVPETDTVTLPSAPGFGNPFFRMVHAQIGELAVGMPLHRYGNVTGFNKRIVAGNILQTGILEKVGDILSPALHGQ